MKLKVKKRVGGKSKYYSIFFLFSSNCMSYFLQISKFSLQPQILAIHMILAFPIHFFPINTFIQESKLKSHSNQTSRFQSENLKKNGIGKQQENKIRAKYNKTFNEISRMI